MVKTHGKTMLKTLALFAALSGGIILLTDAASNQVNAEETTVVSASVAVEAACTLGVENTEHTATITPGSHTEGIQNSHAFIEYRIAHKDLIVQIFDALYVFSGVSVPR